MTSREELRALSHLADLLQRDLSKVSEDDLIQGIREAELLSEAAPQWSGRLLALLYRRTQSWPEVGRITGVPRTTAYRRAEPWL